MKFSSNTDIIELVKRLNGRLKKINLNEIWVGFRKLRFALYNNSSVYLSSSNDNEVEVIKWDHRFVGNTSIKLDEEYIGIWNISTFNDDITEEVLFSKIIHELFHGYQATFNNWPAANEFSLIGYPFTTETVALMLQERTQLFYAVLEDNIEKKNNYISRFIQYRSKRYKLLGEVFLYDLGVESNEGTASYVEFKTIQKILNRPQKDVLIDFWNKLYEPKTVLSNYRSGCYATGLFICLLLDFISVNWHKDFIDSNKSIYDFMLSKYSPKSVDLPPINKLLSQSILESYIKTKNEKFNKFYDSKGKDIIINGSFELRGLDPLNIVAQDNAILHKHFLMINDGENDLMIKGPLISKHKDKVWIMTEIHIKHSETPQVKKDKVYIDGIGKIKGTLME